MNFTDELLQKTDPRSFYGRFTKLRKQPGKPECKGLCPLHDEKTPSFFVNLKTGSFKCFGCGEGGGPIQFEAKRLGISTEQASKRLAQEFQLNARARDTGIPACDSKRRSNSRNRTAEKSDGSTGKDACVTVTRLQILQAILDFGLPLHDRAVAYFARRKIHPETLDRFQIAYLLNPFGTARKLEEQFSLDDLLNAGVYRKSKGPPRFIFLNYPLLFPILQDGRPVYLQGRRMSGPGPKYMNLNGGTVPALFNVDRLKTLTPRSPLYLCEGAPDTLTLDQAGFAAVGLVGSGGFKAEWIKLLVPFDVHLALDADNGGRSGAQRIAELLHREDLPVSIVQLPQEGQDVNDYFLSHSPEDFRGLVAQARREAPELRSVVEGHFEATKAGDKFSPGDLAKRAYRWFERNGGIFLKESATPLLLFEDELLNLDGAEFGGLLIVRSGLTPAQPEGRALQQTLSGLCLRMGRNVGSLGWTHFDREVPAVSINLHDDKNRILRLSPGQTELLPNGANPSRVLLGRSPLMRPIDYDPSADPGQAVRLFRQLVLEALSCPKEHRLFIGAWILSMFFLESIPHKALLKMSGLPGSGKTTAIRALCCFVYGEDHTDSGTPANYYTAASRNPFLMIDNLETRDLGPSIRNFLIHVASGVSRSKRKMGTDDEQVTAKSRALVALTAVEPLTTSELISRAYDVEFDRGFKLGGFVEGRHMARLTDRRSLIFSGLLRLFADQVMPGLEQRWSQYLLRLQGLFPDHPRDRANGFLALMLIILRALLPHLEKGSDVEERLWQLAEGWMRRQAETAKRTVRETDLAVYLMELLAQQMQLRRREDFRSEFGLDCREVRDGKEVAAMTFVAKPLELMSAFQSLCKLKGMPMPFATPQQMGVRMKCEADALASAGWERTQVKVVRGDRFHRYVKKLK